jgi:crotonobetainyl-CoA:carnitine CoA-transferase CaiB-like acyl-CoA transferase
MTSMGSDAPLAGVLVLDAARMLPGAVLARMLLDLGARLIKIEDPVTGDPLRNAPPDAGGSGAGFAAFLRGAESVCLDLGRPEGAARLRKLARHADVLIESFRPGTLARWGLAPERLRASNPRLVVCSLSGFGQRGDAARWVGHDLNLTASAGLLSLLPLARGVPRIQLADVPTGVLACSAVLAALLRRDRTGAGGIVDQPLATGPLPLMTWVLADQAAGGGGLNDHVLAGDCPCYRTYSCQDGVMLAVGALEPKFWAALCELLERPDLAGLGLDTGEAGERAAAEVAALIGARPSGHWVAIGRERGLPISAVADLAGALAPGGFLDATGLGEATPLAEGRTLATPGPYLPSLGRTPERPAPRLGEHTDAVLAEFGLDGG